MADTYGVAPSDVAAELKGLFPTGFSGSTNPTDTMVEGWISTADIIVQLRVADITGASPSSSDKAAVLARRYIIDWTKEQVLRTVYAGNDPDRVDAAARPYQVSSKAILSDLETLGAQAAGEGDASPRVRVSSELPDRDLVITDDMLDVGSFRTRSF